MKQNENNDKWLAEIKDKMLDFQAEVPANGWERVSSALPNSDETRRSEVAPFRRLRWWGLVASVLLCLVIGGGYLLQNKNSEQQTLVKGKLPQEKHPQDLPTNTRNNKPQILVADNIFAVENKGLVTTDNKVVTEKKASSDTIATPDVSQPIKKNEDTTRIETKPESSEHLLTEVLPTEQEAIANNSEASHTVIASSTSIYTNKERLDKDNSHWSFGLNLGGHGSLLASNLGSNLISNSGTMDDPYFGTGSNGTLTDLDDCIVESSNHTSWSIGISVDKEILPHTYIETGVVYTMLSSDVRYKYAGVQAQKVHYLGVPLRVNYMLFSSKPYQLYVGGGMMLEHSLYATRDGKRFDVEPWQLSSNVSLGGQYKISKNLSLYIEPGLSCYFNANKDIPTLRTESPLYFNIRGGVRWLPY